MIESKLTELLEHTGDQLTVGPPPIEALRAGAARRRRRRTAAVSLTSAAVVAAVIAGTTLLTQGSGRVDPQPPVASGSPGTVPDGMRLVGFGHAAIAVPNEWGTNQYRCTTPQKDTVVIDVGAYLMCYARRPAGVESVDVSRGRPKPDYQADETIEVDGVPAERQRTACSQDTAYGTESCSGTVFIPSLDVAFRAESSTSAAEVDRILERIVIVPDRVGVPGYRTVDRRGHQPSGAEYAELLRQAGFKPVIQTRRSSGPAPGSILTASPGPGTMLAPGSTVTITVVS
jgi:hypothetical protein